MALVIEPADPHLGDRIAAEERLGDVAAFGECEGRRSVQTTLFRLHCPGPSKFIRESVIGRDDVVDGPFGPRRVTYADYTASGRSLSFIEDYIRDQVLPLYANTHTESSGTGLQTTRYREEAREIIRRCVGADDEHAVLFTGSGSTGAIDLMTRPRSPSRRGSRSVSSPRPCAS